MFAQRSCDKMPTEMFQYHFKATKTPHSCCITFTNQISSQTLDTNHSLHFHFPSAASWHDSGLTWQQTTCTDPQGGSLTSGHRKLQTAPLHPEGYAVKPTKPEFLVESFQQGLDSPSMQITNRTSDNGATLVGIFHDVNVLVCWIF